jgi:hypothetical protein
MKLIDYNKQELKAWDLFKFRDGWQIIYEVVDWGFTWYSQKMKEIFPIDKLDNFKFEIVGNSKDWIDPKYSDYVVIERMKRGEYFLDS